MSLPARLQVGQSAGPALAKAEIIPHHQMPDAQQPDQQLLDKRLRRQFLEVLLEGGAIQVVDTK